MNQQILSSLSPATHRILGSMLLGTAFEVDLEPEVSRVEAAPIPEVQPAPVKAEPAFNREFVTLLRANLRAAAQHTVLAHEGASFRECSRPACRDAAKLVPVIEGIDLSAADAELDAVLDNVLAALEQNLLEVPPVRRASAR